MGADNKMGKGDGWVRLLSQNIFSLRALKAFILGESLVLTAHLQHAVGALIRERGMEAQRQYVVYRPAVLLTAHIFGSLDPEFFIFLLCFSLNFPISFPFHRGGHWPASSIQCMCKKLKKPNKHNNRTKPKAGYILHLLRPLTLFTINIFILK